MKSEEKRTNALPLTDGDSAPVADEGAGKSTTEEKAKKPRRKNEKGATVAKGGEANIDTVTEESKPTELTEPVSVLEEEIEAVAESSPKEAGEAVAESSPNGAGEAVAESSPKEAGEAVAESSPKEEGEAVAESSPKEAGEAVAESSPKEAGEAVVESSPKEAGEAVAEGSPKEEGEAVAEPVGTVADESASAEATALPDDASDGGEDGETAAEIKCDEPTKADGEDTEVVEPATAKEAESIADIELIEAIADEDEPKHEVAVEGSHGGESKATPTPERGARKMPPKEKKQRAGDSRRVDSLFDFIELFVFTLAAVLFISAFFVRHSVVDGDSMLGTLHDGENLLISDFLYTPEAGDIVVVEDHSTILQKPIIKRVIAVGGDTVRITRNAVIVNGVVLEEDYVFTDGAEYMYEIFPSNALSTNDTLVVKVGEYYEFVVPEGELFVMGDHRNKSTDSREIGTVDEDAVLGRVILRFYPFDKFGKV